MGSYNYDMLHRQTSGIKRAWTGIPIAQQPSYRALEPLYVGQGGYGSFNGAAAYDGLYAGAMPLAADRDIYGSRLPPMGPWAMPDLREPVLLPEPESPLSSPSSSAPEEEPPLAGMIFGCTSNTFMDCMQLRLFALPAANQKDVMRVAPGTKLFLYNYTTRELSGIFEATSHGDMHIISEAFQGFFPAQVCVQCVETCPNLPLKTFKEAITENFTEKSSKFKYTLTNSQVTKLVTLFQQEAKKLKKKMKQQQYRMMSSRLRPGRDKLAYRGQY